MNFVCRTAPARRGGVAACRACAGGASALALAPPALHTTARLPAALHAVIRPAVYRLPHDVRDRLTAALIPYRNRDSAFALATFLGRFWSTPARLLAAFPIDRRELAEHAALGLTEARVRGAIRTLEEVGFLDRARGLGLDPQADAGRAASQAGAVHVRERLRPAVQRGQQAGCGGP